MDKTSQTVIGVALLAAAAVLLLFFRETQVGWFRGQPLGIVLAVVGAIDLAEAAWKGRRTAR